MASTKDGSGLKNQQRSEQVIKLGGIGGEAAAEENDPDTMPDIGVAAGASVRPAN
jgi:hypothetical protein